ncbi:Hydroxymethylglutaryl-CoA lyase [hydrothermal vent metagenome]|uniref:Hydroxymethylglutaryl-CoA lyase n=1 Tax=hydrothermal vent metagenome TaxID=652676 RepID=A0A3B0TGY2_9ZZZZ
MRSLLFVPADDERKIAKAATTGADALILDLEDSVAPARKDLARRMVADAIGAADVGGPKLYVRLNPLTSGLVAADLAAIMAAHSSRRLHGVMQPKARSAADAVTLCAMIAGHERQLGIAEGSTQLIVLVTESAAAVQSMSGYDAAAPRLAGLTWGAEDLSADIGAAATRDENGAYSGPYALARTQTLIAAAAAGTAAIDTVYPDFRDAEGFARDCAEAVRDGFTAKMAIHPAQVPVINQTFTPTQTEIASAQRIVAAFDDADTGVIALDGRMLDRPHLLRARRLLARAKIGG